MSILREFKALLIAALWVLAIQVGGWIVQVLGFPAMETSEKAFILAFVALVAALRALYENEA